jgi:hypothetical protein
MDTRELVRDSVLPTQKVARAMTGTTNHNGGGAKKKPTGKTIEQRREENRSSKAYGKLPKTIRNDRRLSATGLVVIGYRSTFTGRFRLRPELLQCIASNKPAKGSTTSLSRNGLGSKSVRKAINKNRELGYLHRTHKGRHVHESMGFKTTETTPQIKRCWFDGSL